ncbi:hypothetical protein [Halodesulfovibrio marinisediminis]|uniref:Uncharacterized protein n=1 Tax=Halodesulfovibrio marinisediminis DSM 17456 TaxID=1121457 RepID=A0A1N6J8K5_9BACT|nr:hypothetical protein [Halodesulfovibrio marinisediminis]SIO40698.1 hypothetical protein SAMN02745161_3231 [Halodesulfovibrio marinisediminis DSM 17456]
MQEYSISKSSESKGCFGIMGHAGAGHVHSHSGFIQDDTVGFVVATTLMAQAYPVDTTIKSITVEGDCFVVATEDGGIGRARARRGINPYEAELVLRAVGGDAVYSQKLLLELFGRFYGQGVTEVPVALQIAMCHAVLNTFLAKYPENFVYEDERLAGTCGGCLGTVLTIDGHPVSVLATLNATAGGVGPIEDAEGNLAYGGKGIVMQHLGLESLPTIILESKAYVPSVCSDLSADVLWVRYNEEADNPVVGKALCCGAHDVNVVTMCSNTAYERGTTELATMTHQLGERIAELGVALSAAQTSAEKVSLIGELAELVSQDAGGVTFMSSDLNSVVGGGGLQPGMAAVLSMAVSGANIRRWRIPAVSQKDVMQYLRVIAAATPHLVENIDEAVQIVRERKVVMPPDTF